MTTICVGLASWIIQDGNYGDFQAGAEYRFALEFYPHEIAVTRSDATVFRPLAGADYDVCAKVVHLTRTSWVIDFGVAAFQDSEPPSWVEDGSSIAGRIYVGIDPFFYLEYLKDAPGMPNLFREWKVEKIFLETTPWKETATPTGGKMIERERVPPTFAEVQRTDAWNDDSGRAHYILQCKLVGAG